MTARCQGDLLIYCEFGQADTVCFVSVPWQFLVIWNWNIFYQLLKFEVQR